MNQENKTRGRNSPCHCGSGKKYKQCCLVKDEAAQREARAAAAKEAAAAIENEPAEAGEGPAEDSAAGGMDRTAHHQTPRRDTAQPWKRGAANAPSAQRKSLPRKTGGK